VKALPPAEIIDLGYELQRDGSWKLVRPEARPKPRPGLCRGCQKFDAMFSGICAGCAYFGLGDPHGVNTERRPIEPDDVPDLLREQKKAKTERERNDYAEIVEKIREAARRRGYV